MDSKRILVFANDEGTIYNFRREILAAFHAQGYQTVVCYPLGENTEEIQKNGCKAVNLEVSRHGKNIFKDLKLICDCWKLIRTYHPSIVLTYTVKPNIYGSIACQFAHVRYINNVTGLGSVLQNDSVMSKLVLLMQKIAYRKSDCVFFQNEFNCLKMRGSGIIRPEIKTRVLPGSGVSLEKQKYEEYPKDDGIIRFVIVSRIRRDKGYKEYFDAAEVVRRKYPSTEFHVIGWYEEEGLRRRLDSLADKGIIIYHGKKSQEEVHGIVSQCSCLVHPSYHEGMANVLLEAAATGRPVIASKIPGCIEAFEEGVTGFGCLMQDSSSLIEALEKFICIPYEQKVEMGKAGRCKMEKQFNRKFVAEMYIDAIENNEVHEDV